MKVGILGGTFDPIHFGHLRATEEVREFFGLEKIIIVPANIAPHKKDVKVSPAEDRFNMVRMAINGNESLEISDIEIARGGISYTIDTLIEFEKRYEDLYYLIGMDAFHEIDTWHMYEQIFYHTNLVIMARPSKRVFLGLDSFPEKVRESVVKIDENTFKHISSKMIHVLKVTQLDISSSKIRDYVKNGFSIRYLVPPSVERYIYQRRLYRD